MTITYQLARFRLLLVAFLAILLAACGGDSEPYPLDPFAGGQQSLVPEESTIGFVYKLSGASSDGRFNRFTAQVSFDPAKPEATQATFSVELASIDVGDPGGNSEAGKPIWFNVATYPRATFTARSVKALGGGKYEARGPLTIKGTSRDVVVQFTARPSGQDLQLDGGFTVKRLQYNLGSGSWADIVGDDVQVNFRFVLAGRPWQ